MLSRHHGFGSKGSVLTAAVFGFMIIGFLALENALLYKGFLFYLNRPDTLSNRVMIYGGLTLAWVVITAFGFGLVSRVSSWMLVAFRRAGVHGVGSDRRLRTELERRLCIRRTVPAECPQGARRRDGFRQVRFLRQCHGGFGRGAGLIDADLGAMPDARAISRSRRCSAISSWM